MNENQRPENMDEIYSKESIDFLCQYKVRSAIMRVLKDNFDVQELLVIKEKLKEADKQIPLVSCECGEILSTQQQLNKHKKIHDKK